MLLRTSDIAASVGGRLHGPDVEIRGVAIDSRGVKPGELFVPIRAERDGHDFIDAAVAAGAAAYLTARPPAANHVTAIVVADTSAALLDVGRYARGRLPDRVVGITGSVGKTSSKDLTAAALAPRFPTSASERSFNNELGVPLTLANAPDGTEAVVAEMGARSRGHITLLCSVARPTIGLVTVVAAAHTEMFGTVDEVAAAKTELVAALPDRGTAVLNADDPRVAAMARAARGSVITYSPSSAVAADVVADDVILDDLLRPAFTLRSPWGTAPVRLDVHGAHNVGNALGAAAAAMAAGATPDEVAAGMATAHLSPWRMELSRAPSGLVVLNDAYNANPTSTEAALRSLAAVPAQRRFAVLGLMAELGDLGPGEHRRIADVAASLGVELIAVDSDDYGTDPVDGVDGALRALRARGAGAGDAVLVKGSRVAGLERVAAVLTGAAPG